MPLIGDEEILARVHGFKLFRSEGNLHIDLYEAILGEPPHKFIAVPNIVIKEASENYFGVGDTRKAALVDCLRKIRDVPLAVIVPPETYEGKAEQEKPKTPNESEELSEPSPAIRKISRLFSRKPKDAQDKP